MSNTRHTSGWLLSGNPGLKRNGRFLATSTGTATRLPPQVTVWRQFADRIKVLEEDLVEDGLALNPASLRDFWMFVGSVHGIRKDCLYAHDDGNLRAVWADSEDRFIGLEFLGNQKILYVMHSKQASGAIKRIHGWTSFHGAKKLIVRHSLLGVMKK